MYVALYCLFNKYLCLKKKKRKKRQKQGKKRKRSLFLQCMLQCVVSLIYKNVLNKKATKVRKNKEEKKGNQRKEKEV